MHCEWQRLVLVAPNALPSQLDSSIGETANHVDSPTVFSSVALSYATTMLDYRLPAYAQTQTQDK